MEYKDVEIISSHKYIKNTLTYATVLTEDLLNTSRRPQTPERKRPPHNPGWDEREKKAGGNLRPSEGAVRVARTERELQRRVSQPVCDRERDRAAVCAPACAAQPETHIDGRSWGRVLKHRAGERAGA